MFRCKLECLVFTINTYNEICEVKEQEKIELLHFTKDQKFICTFLACKQQETLLNMMKSQSGFAIYALAVPLNNDQLVNIYHSKDFILQTG